MYYPENMARDQPNALIGRSDSIKYKNPCINNRFILSTGNYEEYEIDSRFLIP